MKNTTSRILSISEARKKIFQIAEEVQKPSTYYMLTENGSPKAVIMSAQEFDSWKETLEVMWEFPDLQNDIQKADKEYGMGDYITLDQLLEKQGYVLREKAKQQYGVSNRNSKKSSKGAK